MVVFLPLCAHKIPTSTPWSPHKFDSLTSDMAFETFSLVHDVMNDYIKTFLEGTSTQSALMKAWYYVWNCRFFSIEILCYHESLTS